MLRDNFYLPDNGRELPEAARRVLQQFESPLLYLRSEQRRSLTTVGGIPPRFV